MKKGRIKRWLGRSILLIFILWLFYLIGYRYIYLNLPSKVSRELQEKITEAVGKGYKLRYPGPEESGIDSVRIEVDTEMYKDEKLFENCDELKDVIYDFVKENPQNFELCPVADREREEKWGFIVYFEDWGSPYLDDSSNIVFWLSNYLQQEDKYDESFSFLGAATYGVGGYGFQLSNFKYVNGIKELSLTEIDIDNAEALGEMESLKYFYWLGDIEDGERLKEAAKKYGVKFIQKERYY